VTDILIQALAYGLGIAVPVAALGLIAYWSQRDMEDR